ncbi:MAG: choice-of-anchor B family protein [Wenzhouxiangellaceae bacterium]|nr:choice-of-anchor B family protein [Wenzhouxiangellaceae bacterium]
MKTRVTLTTLLLVAPIVAWACFTQDRAAVLGVLHPDSDFENLAHRMHGVETIEYAYRGPAGCVDGMSDIFPCQGMELAGWLELSEIGGGSGSDSWGWTDPLTGREYALMARSNGVAFVDISDPAGPVYIGNLPRPDGVGTSVWADIKTYADHAFIVADAVSDHGVQVFDLTRLRDVASPPVTFTMDAHYLDYFDGTGTPRRHHEAHNIAVNEETGFAYTTGGNTCAGGLHMIDIRTPTSPQFAGCFSADGYTHDVQCVVYRGPDSRYAGREICFASNEDTVTVVDVTDKSAPVQIGEHGYNRTGYTHQGWLTGDHRYFVTDDELDEQNFGLPGTRTLVFDLQALDAAPEPAEYIASDLSIDHNQYVIGGYAFQANYKRGLRVLRIDDPDTAAMTEVAYFDTYPSSNGTGFSGAWNVYPFFESGIVLVSDINRGLFAVRVTDSDLLAAMTQIVFADGFE